jgi:hypothetical protein
MSNSFNVYCDESCHLENDHQKAMVLGAVWCPVAEARAVARRLRQLKAEHGLAKSFEIKWTKVSPAGVRFYLDVINFFFDSPELHYRAVVIPDKSLLRHDERSQDHDTWYYKMYFNLLKVILEPHCRYRIYLDIKDTQSVGKVHTLHDVLCNNMYDFDRTIIDRVQTVHSDEVEQIQLADLLTGAVCYVNRGAISSSAKRALIDQVRRRSGYSLDRTTLLQEKKFNIFVWKAKEDR